MNDRNVQKNYRQWIALTFPPSCFNDKETSHCLWLRANLIYLLPPGNQIGFRTNNYTFKARRAFHGGDKSRDNNLAIAAKGKRKFQQTKGKFPRWKSSRASFVQKPRRTERTGRKKGGEVARLSHGIQMKTVTSDISRYLDDRSSSEFFSARDASSQRGEIKRREENPMFHIWIDLRLIRKYLLTHAWFMKTREFILFVNYVEIQIFVEMWIWLNPDWTLCT